MGVASKNYAKVGYVCFQLCWILTAVLCFFFFGWLIDWTENIGIECPDESGGSSACFGASGIVRMSWSLAIFHTLTFLIILSRTDCAAMYHDGWWCLKMCIVLALFVSSMWIPNEPVIDGYMKFARYVSFIFLMYQAVLMLVVSYVLNELLVGNFDREGQVVCSCSGIILLSVFIILTVGNIVWIVYQFILFGGCGDNITWMIITCVFGFLSYAIVLFRPR